MKLDEGTCGRLRGILGERADEWLAGLPHQIAQLEAEWDLQFEGPCWGAYAFVFPCTAGGAEAVLKITHPEQVARPELRAMQAWAGRGAAQLLRVDEARGAMLMERLRPGWDLTTVVDREGDAAATSIACEVMRALPKLRISDPAWVTAAGRCEQLECARAFFGGGAGPIGETLLDLGVGLFRDLVASQSEEALLHGDLHHENILQRGDDWLVIDPHGVVAEPAFEVGTFLRNPDALLLQPDLSAVLRRRVDQMADLLPFSKERIVAWGIAQSVLSAWWTIEAGEDGYEEALLVAETLRHLRAGISPSV